MKKLGKMAREVLSSLFKKEATSNYPFSAAVMPEKFRGKIEFTPDLCIGCKLCMRDCPSNAIFITKVGDKRFECMFKLDRCIYCAQCVDTCPKKALATSKNFELAAITRASLEDVTKPKSVDAPVTPVAEPVKE